MQKNITIMIVAALLFLSINCGKKDKATPWVISLDESKVTILAQPVTKIKKHVEAIQQFQKKGQVKKVNEEFKQLNQTIEKMEFFYLPLLNARNNIANAYRLTERNETAKVQGELQNSRAQLTIAKSKATGDILKEVSLSISQVELLEKELSKTKDKTKDRFAKIADPITNLINKN